MRSLPAANHRSRLRSWSRRAPSPCISRISCTDASSTSLMVDRAFRCAYFSPALEEIGWTDQPQLVPTSERHRLRIERPALSSVENDPLTAAAGADGIVLEMWLGWPAFRHLRLASRALRRGRRVWAYWPNEEAIECVDRDWLASGWRHWFLASCYFT